MQYNIPTSEIPLYTPNPRQGGPSILSFGGGHGMYAALSAFRLLSENITAVVTVADDGGSSGRLRAEFGGLPPGDLRMALAALCDDGDWGQNWRDVIQYRFESDGELNEHSVGNLILTALWQILGDHVEGLDWMARLVRAHGRVLPMSSVPLAIEADVIDDAGNLETIIGQAEVAVCKGTVQSVRLQPQDPPARAETVEAIAQAQVLNFGPGSWYTSVMPHLLVPELREAITAATGIKMLTLNIPPAKEDREDEASGLTQIDLLQSLHTHAPELRLDYIVVDEHSLTSPAGGLNLAPGMLAQAASELFGARLWSADVGGRRAGVHDSLKLASCYRDILADAGIAADE